MGEARGEEKRDIVEGTQGFETQILGGFLISGFSVLPRLMYTILLRIGISMFHRLYTDGG